MEIFGVGPLELLLVLVIALVILGPEDMVGTARKLGQWVYRVVRSPTWRAILDTTADLRELPQKIVRDAGLEEAVNEVKATANQVKSEMGATTAQIDAEMKAASSDMSSEMKVAVTTAQAGLAEAQATVTESVDAAAQAAQADAGSGPPRVGIPVLDPVEPEAPVPFSPGEPADQPVWPEQALANYTPPGTEPGETAAAPEDGAEPTLTVVQGAAVPLDAEAAIPLDAEAAIPLDAEAAIPQGDAETPIPLDAEAAIPLDAEAAIPLDAEAAIPLDAEAAIPLDAEAAIPQGDAEPEAPTPEPTPPILSRGIAPFSTATENVTPAAPEGPYQAGTDAGARMEPEENAGPGVTEESTLPLSRGDAALPPQTITPEMIAAAPLPHNGDTPEAEPFVESTAPWARGIPTGLEEVGIEVLLQKRMDEMLKALEKLEPHEPPPLADETPPPAGPGQDFDI